MAKRSYILTSVHVLNIHLSHAYVYEIVNSEKKDLLTAREHQGNVLLVDQMLIKRLPRQVNYSLEFSKKIFISKLLCRAKALCHKTQRKRHCCWSI